MNFNCLPDNRIFAEFDRQEETDKRLSRLCEQLLIRQKELWPKLKKSYEAVTQALVRTVDCNSFSVKLQFNPRRIVSSGAKVDPAAIAARPCFLCPANLPESQLGILYHRKFLILCNPFPIFSSHFTISSLDHRPQAVEEDLDVFLHLARGLAPSFAVFYNGPQCGASAPDHLHLQA
jgi:ATP adenylyltransferase/5',5'''-P-1,P-4-tetraphosphate phosphorylase II